MSDLLAGAGKAVVTPPVGYHMGAWGLRQGRSTGVHDDLFVKALVLANGDERIALVAMDVAGITRGILEGIQQRIEELTGIPASHLLVNSTHNHTTPDLGITVHIHLQSATVQRSYRLSIRWPELSVATS